MRTHNSWIGCLCLMMTGCLSPIRTPQAPASSTPPEEASAIASWEEPIAAGPIPLGPVDGTPIRPSRPKTPSEPECSNPSYSVQRISHPTFDGNDLILDQLTNSDLVRGRTYSRGALRREFIWNAETETLRTLRDLTLPPSESFTFMSSERAVNDLGELAGTSCGLQSGAWTCYPTVERLGGSHQVYSQGTFADLRGANFLFINNAGQAVGNYIASDYRTRVMFLKDPQTLVDIGDLGARFLVPRAMSNTGVVVGDAWFDQDGGGYRHQAFVYDSNSHQLQLIPHLVTPLPQFPSSVVGSTAIDVSDTGQILLHTSRQYADGSCSINATSTNECHYEIRRFDSVGIREETLPWEFTANSIVASGIFDRMRMNSSGSILGQEMIANYPYNDNPNYDPSIPMGSYSLGVVRSQGEMRRLDYGKLIGYPEHLVGQILDFNDSGQILARIQKLGGYTVVGGVHSPVWIEVHEVLLRPTCR